MPLKFSVLWANHPTTRGDDAPCSTNGKSNFENQCAIRMGVALKACGVNFATFRGARCWFGHSHVIRAEELANWLKTQTTQIGKVEICKKVTYANFAGRSGIVFFRNFWGVGNQGDHIDLWDGSQIRKGDLSYFSRSQEVWFWPIA